MTSARKRELTGVGPGAKRAENLSVQIFHYS